MTIQKAISYATKEQPSFGGFVLVGKIDKKIVGITVVNKTGMEDYLPEFILVYVAIHKDIKDRETAREIIKETVKRCRGNIALHLAPNHPAKDIFESVGFESQLVEMRLYKKK